MHRNCSGHDTPTTPSVYQTIDEMDFERGIWSAALMGDSERVLKLLEKGHSPNSEDRSGYTALHYAARSGHTGICATLLAFGSFVDSTTRSGKATPLQRAALAGHADIVQLLLKHQASPRIKDQDGRTALHRAVEGGSSEVVSLLLSASPEMAYEPDNFGKTPADHAQMKPHIVQLFTTL